MKNIIMKFSVVLMIIILMMLMFIGGSMKKVKSKSEPRIRYRVSANEATVYNEKKYSETSSDTTPSQYAQVIPL